MRIATYKMADRVLGSQNRVKLPGQETYLNELDIGDDEPYIGLRYQQTNVLIFAPNGDVIYNTGGWHTGTTAKRMAGWGPENVEIIYERGVIALSVGGKRYDFPESCALIVHADNTVEPYDGPVDSPRQRSGHQDA